MAEFRPRVWVRRACEKYSDSVLRSVLEWSDQGILVTDLEHRSIACNWRFGELFGLSPEFMVSTDPESVRMRMYPQLENPERWRNQLNEVYADPLSVLSDVLTLKGPRASQIKRFTTPVCDLEGNAVARLWTFSKLVDQGFVGAFGCLYIDSGSRDAKVDGKSVGLTRKEFDLLTCLVQHAGKVVSRQDLFRNIWGYDLEFASNTLDVYMHRLRRKLGNEQWRVRTLPKSGYLFDPGQCLE